MRLAFLSLMVTLLMCSVNRTLVADEGLEFFEKKIRPVLVKHCYECHSSEASTKKKLKGNLLLDSRAGLLSGGVSGAAIVPGKPSESSILSALRYESLEMPPEGKLPDSVISDFEAWIQRGAPDPRTSSPNVILPAPDDAKTVRRSWAFEPVKTPAPPQVADDDWSAGEIDRFVYARLSHAGLHPVEDADRRTLLRRLSFDLTGLPPTASQIDAFVHSSDPNALPEVVDRLLQSPHFGERWGRHWLDVARYADSVGGGANVVLDNAWRYRDYVIDSFNQDKPFDQFVKEQVAGDLLPPGSNTQRRERLIATGFLALGAKELAEYDMMQLQWDTVDEQIDTVGKSLMGLTLGCARCHDHKFDAISTNDYYALAGIFRSTQTLLPKRSGVIVQWTRLSLPGDEKQKAVGVAEVSRPGDCKICIRGNKDQLGPSVARGFPQAITTQGHFAIDGQQSGRLQLAQWLTHPQHPLTARVFVNRVWQHLLGEGLVRTPDNFGTRGQSPTHPELLDYLASKFIADDWSIKRLVRSIVLSRVYQLTSKAHDAAGLRQQGLTTDPENRLLWRHNRRRLDAEAIRDAMLAVSGQLDTHPFGNTMTYTGRIDTPKSDKKTKNPVPWQRRSVYLPRYRGAYEHDLLKTFDAPPPALVTGRRHETNVPTQALFLMNSPFVYQQAQCVARLTKDCADNAARLDDVYRRVLGRKATRNEMEKDMAFINECRKAFESASNSAPFDSSQNADLAAWSSLCQTLIAGNEFLFLD